MRIGKIANKNSTKKGSPPNGSVNGRSRQEQVAELAYQYYLERGCQDGYDVEDWLRAEQEVKKS